MLLVIKISHLNSSLILILGLAENLILDLGETLASSVSKRLETLVALLRVTTHLITMAYQLTIPLIALCSYDTVVAARSIEGIGIL